MALKIITTDRKMFSYLAEFTLISQIIMVSWHIGSTKDGT